MIKIVDKETIIWDIKKRYLSYWEDEKDLIGNAYKYALKSHEGKKRKSGDPYINHPLLATQELMVIEPDLITIVATILHDTVSDGTGTFDEIEKLFWQDVRRIVEALDKIGLIKYRWNESTIERLQRTLLAMAQDVRSIFVKFADRIDNLRSLQYHETPETAKRIADESLSIYAPIAARLGLYAFKETMETLALRELDLDGYLQVTGELAHYTLEQDKFLTQSIDWVRKMLPEKYRDAVSYRVKKPYSIYRKLKQYDVKSIRDIYDVFAIRIIVDDISDCYAVLGIIHGNFTPLSERFKDFIAVPKSNGYQSLHTTVLGFDGYKQPIEIQIRTKQMDQDAERGHSFAYSLQNPWWQHAKRRWLSGPRTDDYGYSSGTGFSPWSKSVSSNDVCVLSSRWRIWVTPQSNTSRFCLCRAFWRRISYRMSSRKW
jgi:guanosine-3',5'-bis(diphosphate) 3'-pyrophosphohydrolase